MQGPFSGGKRPAAGSDLTGGGKNPTLVPPLSAGQAINLYGERLSAWERQEIRQHYSSSGIYFVGKRSGDDTQKSERRRPSDWETLQGDYKPTPGDHLGYRYEILKKLGAGTFGQVVEAFDHKRGRKVAVKIIKNQKEFQKQGNVEVRILQHIMKSDPQHKSMIIRCRGFFHFRSHLCISFDLLGCNLFEHIQERRYRGLDIASIRNIAKQLFVALQHLRKLKIIHCDIKPENVLLKSSGHSTNVRLIDFGASCFEDRVAFSYIQSRFYRAPEVILGLDYGPEIDVWSVGAMLCELFTGEPLFPGHNEQHQLACIVEVLGLPPREFIDMSPRRSKFFDSQRRRRPIPRNQHCTPNCGLLTDKGFPVDQVVPSSHISHKGCRFALGEPKSRGLDRAIKMGSPPELDSSVSRTAFVHFLSRCLKWLPEDRITPRQALSSDFIGEAAPTGTSSQDKPSDHSRMDVVPIEPAPGTMDPGKFSDLYLTPPIAVVPTDSETVDVEMGLGGLLKPPAAPPPALRAPEDPKDRATKGGYKEIPTVRSSKVVPDTGTFKVIPDRSDVNQSAQSAPGL